jgi:hypothetical protein
MSLPSAIAELTDESIALERSGEVGIALQYARAALDAARASGECEAIAAALNYLFGWRRPLMLPRRRSMPSSR